MTLRYTDKNEIPAEQADNYEEFTEGDNTVYLHKELAAEKRNSYRLQGDLTNLNKDSESMRSKLDELSSAQKIRDGEAEAERLKGLTESQRQQEIIENLTKKVDETEANYQKRIDEAEQKANAKTKSALVNDISASATEANRAILKRMASADLELQSDGTVIVLDADGKATPQTVDEYKSSLKTRYPSLVSAVQSKGGLGQGSDGIVPGKKTYGANIPGFNELPKN